MDTVDTIEKQDELREMIELSVRNALIRLAHGDTDPLDALWRTVLCEQDYNVTTCREQLHSELVRAYLR